MKTDESDVAGMMTAEDAEAVEATPAKMTKAQLVDALAKAQAAAKAAEKTASATKGPDGSHTQAQSNASIALTRGMKEGFNPTGGAELRALRAKQKRTNMTEAEEAEYIRLTNTNTGVPPKDVRGTPGNFIINW